MRLFEYQAKELFRLYGIPVPESYLAKDDVEALESAEKLGFPVAIKAQVLAGGRGKAGGVSIVNNKDELSKEAKLILSLNISGEKPRAILVEKAIKHEKEYYISISLDRGQRSFVLIASREGGIDVESLETKLVKKIPINGIDYDLAETISSYLDQTATDKITNIVLSLERLHREKDCELVEINPLCKSGTDFYALDAKINVDDNALFRHPEFSRLSLEDELEQEASRYGFAFVRLEGDIAVIGNGAGLVLSTLDLVADAGGKPACFLDLGGGAQKERVEAAILLVNKLENVRKILVNIFGGITRTIDVAEGILSALEKVKTKPIYARISGAEEEEARKILEGSNVLLYQTANDAVKEVTRPL